MFAYPVERGAGKYTFQVQGYLNKWGKLVDEYETYLDSIIGEYFDDYKFYMEFFSEWVTSNLPQDIKLEELWNLVPNIDYPLPILSIYLPSPEESVDSYKRLIEDGVVKKYISVLLLSG